MAANVGYATLNVIPSAKGFGKALRGEVDPAMAASGKAGGSSLVGGLRAVAGPLMAAAGAATMGIFVASAIKQAGALEQSMGAIDSVFKGSAGQMHDWAASAATAVGLTRNQYNELGTLIGSQLKNAGTAMDDLGPSTNRLIGAGADLASMFGGTTKEAVEAISSALKGERDPIERYGVSLKQASIDAKAAELGFEKVNGALTNEANAAATLALIMEQTTDAHGNFAKEAVTYEGVMQRLSASWGNVTTTIGQGFLPFATAAGSILLAMMPAVQGVADNFNLFGAAMSSAFTDAGGGIAGIQAMFASIGQAIADWFAGGGVQAMIAGGASLRDGLLSSIATALPGILSAIVAMAPSILSAAVASFQSLALGLLQSIPPLITTLLGMAPMLIMTLLGMVPALLASALTLFMGIIQGLVVVIPQIVTALVTMLPSLATALISMLPGIVTAGLEMFMGIVQAVVQLIPVLITAVLDLLPVLIETILGMLPGIIDSALTLFLGIVTALLTAIPQVIVALLRMLPQLISTLIGMIPKLLESAVKLFKGIVEALPVVLPLIIDALIKIGPELVRTLISMVPLLIRAGIDLIGGLVKGLFQAAGSVVDALLKIAGGAIDAFKSFFGIKSPSRVFMALGGFIGEGLAIGIDGMRGEVTKSVLGLADAAQSAMDRSTLVWSTDVSGAIPEGGVMGSAERLVAALADTGSGDHLEYHQHGGQGLTAEQELVRAARRLKYKAA